jgi:hypothetical protein
VLCSPRIVNLELRSGTRHQVSDRGATRVPQRAAGWGGFSVSRVKEDHATDVCVPIDGRHCSEEAGHQIPSADRREVQSRAVEVHYKACSRFHTGTGACTDWLTQLKTPGDSGCCVQGRCSCVFERCATFDFGLQYMVEADHTVITWMRQEQLLIMNDKIGNTTKTFLSGFHVSHDRC